MDFEELCYSRSAPLDPKKVVVEFLKYRPQIFTDILKNKENVYKELLDTLLEGEKEGLYSLRGFLNWYRDYLYSY